MEGPAARSRDEAGRARNDRPRDGYGRPLARGAAEGVPRVPDDAVFAPDEGLDRAQELLDTDYPFHAHEVLEAVWKAAEEPERELWRGLAQLAVGLTHVRRGNPAGAATLLRRGAGHLAGYPEPAPHRIDTAGLRARALQLADRIDREGLSAFEGRELTLRLRRP
ncbi:DUF309 domain-containing protein [Allonocardiopsis opalescens]|uniref:DUF309 family protein family protein n=1 Tax=Allonocardiopsis opalescens TaxID=1144618 RepID=A0A2T0Q6X8_9ACTN|nr:DUF309 domain-containing protein [Allonocardiopsis opalescens]PRX99483.1 hypothetical protein CLV72_10380 [Allonocardiopsis opalescens]